jgi:hypothetical protein
MLDDSHQNRTARATMLSFLPGRTRAGDPLAAWFRASRLIALAGRLRARKRKC